MHFPGNLMNIVVNAIKKSPDKKGLTDKDWKEILEETVYCLDPHLSTFANTPLGHVRLWGSGDRSMIETDLAETEYNSELPLSTPGFWTEPHGKTLDGPNNIVFWGLTRKHKWAVVQVVAQTIRGKDFRDKEFRRHKAISINAKECAVEEIKAVCGYDFFNIWDSLYLAIDSWASKREDIARAARSFNTGIAGINQIIQYHAR